MHFSMPAAGLILFTITQLLYYKHYSHFAFSLSAKPMVENAFQKKKFFIKVMTVKIMFCRSFV